jgi:hypothetical protein
MSVPRFVQINNYHTSHILIAVAIFKYISLAYQIVLSHDVTLLCFVEVNAEVVMASFKIGSAFDEKPVQRSVAMSRNRSTTALPHVARRLRFLHSTDSFRNNRSHRSSLWFSPSPSQTVTTENISFSVLSQSFDFKLRKCSWS